MVRLRYVYGVFKGDLERFVGENRVVRDWVGKYEERTGRNKARVLCRFFKWLRMERGIHLSPREMLNEQIALRSSDSIEDRRKHLQLAMDFSRDNPDFRELSDRRKYYIFVTIKNFYDYHEVPLTNAKGVFGRRRKPKVKRKQITLSDARRILGALPQRERTILLIVLQSGMEIGAVLNKFNYMWPRIRPQLDAGASRVKVEFTERKGNSFSYFTYFSRDAVQELRKWLIQRQRILNQLREQGRFIPRSILEGQPIFITNQGTAYTEDNFFQTIVYHRKKRRVKKFVSHQFRKLFKTEASLPERGIDRDVVEFMMGHVSSIGSMGGTYDKTPEIHEEVIENEYRKLEKYLNIFSVPPRDILTHREMEQHEMRLFTEKLMKDPKFVGRFLDFLGENLTVNSPEGKIPLGHVVTPKTLTLQRPES